MTTKPNYQHAIEMIQNWERAEICNIDGAWKPVNAGPEFHMLSSLDNPKIFRLAPPPPQKVQWGPKDVRPGMVFRPKGITMEWQTIEYIDAGGVGISGGGWINYIALGHDWEWSTDGVTWAKCEKDEGEE